jgi:hypothetical protein
VADREIAMVLGHKNGNAGIMALIPLSPFDSCPEWRRLRFPFANVWIRDIAVCVQYAMFEFPSMSTRRWARLRRLEGTGASSRSSAVVV